MTTRQLIFGPCAKRRTQAVLIGASGKAYVGENVCLNPQSTCPRAEGEGYEKCTSICRQVGHAEEQAIAAAGDDARGGSITVTHWYACEKCTHIAERAGVNSIECVAEQDSERTVTP